MYFNLTPVLEWCMMLCGSKNGYQKNPTLKEIGLCVQIVISFLIVNIIGGTYMTN